MALGSRIPSPEPLHRVARSDARRLPRARLLTATAALFIAGVLAFGAAIPPAAPTTAAIAEPCGTPTAGHATCMLEVMKPNGSTATPDSGSSGISGLQPADIASAYGLTGGVAGTVAVVDAYDNPNLESDLAVYRAQWGLPACTTLNGCFRKVNQRGSSTSLPAGNAQWGLETSLDVDAVSAACPACNILVVEADSSSLTNMGTAENMAVTLGATAVSNSWGVNENSNAASTSNLYFTHSGVPIVASSGDSGYTSPQMPASLPNVIAVGGTTLTQSTTSASTAASTAPTQSSGATSNVQPAATVVHAKKTTAPARSPKAKKAAAKKAAEKKEAEKKAAAKKAAAKKAAAKRAAAKKAAERKAALLKAQKVSRSPIVVTAPVQAPTPTASSTPVSTPTPTTTATPTPAPTATPTTTPTASASTSSNTVARGWTETAWSSGGSGCSTYIAKPTWQTDTICLNRTDVDIAADANPATGLAVYDTYSSGSYTYNGWLQAGGTSLAAPLVAAMIVRSGNAANYSNAAPIYAHASLFNDVTSGSNGTCSVTLRCTAGVGIDGPTGVGTPMGLSSF